MKNYYDECGEQFVDDTRDLDLSHIYRPFLNLIHKGGKILDAGCGSGRDSKNFLELGHAVEAIDSSSLMVQKASEFTGLDVLKMSFNDIDYFERFNGVWANASLLHIKKSEMREAYKKLHRALINNGVLFVSYKYGEFEGDRGGRYYSDYTLESFRKLIDSIDLFTIESVWQRPDQRESHKNMFWLNALLIKKMGN